MKNRREHVRYVASVTAEIELRGETVEGETRDISTGGASALLPRALPEDSTVDLTMILTQDGIEDPDQEPFTVRANVMWVAPTDDGRAMVGLRFTGLDAAQNVKLTGFLAALARRSR